MRIIVPNYTFDKVAKTITFTDYASISQEKILLVVDATNNTVVYQPNVSGLGGAVATNVLTVTLNTNIGSFNNADKLQIFYEDTTSVAGSVTTAAPTYATGTTQALSLTTTGGLRTTVTGTVPLPTGAATETTLASVDTKTPALGQTVMATSTPVVIASNQTALPITDNAGSLTIDSTQLPAALVGARLDVNAGAWLGSTAPTVGSKTSADSIPVVIASDQGAVAVSVASLPLPSGASTASNQTTLGSQTSKINDGTNTAAVKAASTAAVATDPALVVAISPNNTVAISASSLPLPTSAATETTLSTRLADSTFTGRINTLGQKTSASSTPVVLASDQSTLAISGTVTANVGTTNGLALDATLSAQSAVDNAIFTDGTTRVVPVGYILDEVAGISLAENDVAAARIDSKRAVVNVIEDATTRGQRLAVSATGAAKVDGSAVTQPISVSSLPLPTGAATESTLSGINAKMSALGQTTMSASMPVTIASNQPALPITDNSGSLTVDSTQLPAALVGARLDINAGAWLGSTAPTVGSKTSANSIPVVIASDQGAVAVSAASLPLPSGAATSSNQTTLGSQTSKINDGTNTAAVKAASTAAVATDPALVVTVSPNNTVSVIGTNTPADATANPTTGVVSAAFNNVWNGATWDRQKGNSTTGTFVGGPAAAGAAVVGNPLLTGGSDGTNVRATLLDTSGRHVVVGAAAAGAAFAGNPVLIAGNDGTNARTLFTDAAGRLQTAPTTKTTYSAATAIFTPVATATDIFVITGSATRTVKILSIILSGTQTTAGNIGTISLIKRSTDDTGGTSVAATRIPHDSTNAAATAVVRHYTANPTLGTTVGTVYSPRVSIPAPATAIVPATIFQYNAPDPAHGQPITLRGAAEVIAVNMGGGALPAGAANFAVTVIWTEE